MLTCNPICGSALAGGSKALFDYYAKGSAKLDYYGEHGQEPGQGWLSGARRLEDDFGIDLTQGITAEIFDHLMNGRTPDGEKVIPDSRGVHAPGYDATFAPPKSFSEEMVWASGRRRYEIMRAHDDSLRIALMEWQNLAKVCGVATGRRQCRQDVTGEWIALLFTHYTSRPTPEQVAAGRPPDLGIHTHAVIPNMAWAAGKWRAVRNRDMIYRLREVRYRYEVELTTRLAHLGYKIEWSDEDRRGNRQWEFAGSNRHVRELFSSRSELIRKRRKEFIKTHGRAPNWMEDQEQVVKATRLDKDDACEGEPDWERYAQLIRDAGLDPSEHINLGESQVHDPRTLDTRRLSAWMRLQESLSNRESVFYRYELAASCWVAGVEFLTPGEIRTFVNEITAGDELVLIETASNHDYDRLTTKYLLETERRVRVELTAAASDEIAKSDAPGRKEMNAFMDRSKVPLSAEQGAAVEYLCERGRLRMMTGPAGCGKTTVLDPALKAWKSAGHKVYALAVAGAAADMLANKLTVDGAYTIEGFAYLEELTGIEDGSVIVLDEAVMADTSRMAKLSDLIDKYKLVARFVGDFQQLEAIGAGGMFRSLVTEAGCYELTEVFRQKARRLRHVMDLIRSGNPFSALEILDKSGDLIVEDTWEEMLGSVGQEWEIERLRGRSVEDIIIVSDAPNSELDTMNDIIQSIRLERGEIGGKAYTATSRIDHRTEEWHRGDLVIFTDGYEDDTHRDRWGNVTRVRNGEQGKIIEVEPWGVRVRTEHGIVSVTTTSSAESQPLRLRYATTAYKTQGREADVVLVVPWLATSNLGSAYSMATRCKDSVRVFMVKDTRHRLCEAWSRWHGKYTAEHEIETARRRAEQPFDPVAEHDDNDERAAMCRDVNYDMATIGGHMRMAEERARRAERIKSGPAIGAYRRRGGSGIGRGLV